jgi:outer membrane protein OmpA-like peptidoglycan-associated protein
MKKIFFLIVLAFQFSLVGFSQDTLNHYSDAEVMKLVSYIKTLEARTQDYIAAHPNEAFMSDKANAAQEQQDVNDLVKDSTHRYNDAQIIKLAKYIKYLEGIDVLNTAALADAKKRYDDSVAKAQTLLVADHQDLDKFGKSIFFNFDSYTLKTESHPALDEAVKILNKYPDVMFIVEGHTDNVGADAYNMNLSKERAKAVMDYLVSKGVPATKISSVGYGEEKPIASNETEEGRSKNRRVEIKAKKK